MTEDLDIALDREALNRRRFAAEGTIIHTRTRLSGRVGPYEVFRSACAVTSPLWTECGPDPYCWRAPPDAAGGLVLWDHWGGLIRTEPALEDEAKAAEGAYHVLLYAGAVIGNVLASYASSGGRMVALCASYGVHYITVSRIEETVRVGATEECILRADPDAVVYRMDPVGTTG